MWTKGKVNGYEFSAKVYDEPSGMGINEGRVSKLDLMKGGKVVVSYDRGWRMSPKTEAEKKALNAILNKYPA